MSLLRLDRTLWPAVVGLIVAFGLFETMSWDLAIQDRLFNWQEDCWLVDRTAPVPRWIFYVAPKYLIGAVALGVLVLAWRTQSKEQRRNAVVVFLTTLSVPLLVGFGKDTTNVFCPWDVTRYGGDVPYVHVLQHFPPDAKPERRGRGFPAGHASGGFALVALAGLARSRRGQWLGLSAGLLLGSVMGAYQMMKGAHYLSHTLVTAIFAWIIFLLWRRVFGLHREDLAPARAAQAVEATTAHDAARPLAAISSTDRITPINTP